MNLPKGVSVLIIAMFVPGSMAAASALGSAEASFERLEPQKTLVGTWQTRIRPRDCNSGVVLNIPPIIGVFSFHAGGTTSEYGIGPGATPALRSPGHGVWQREPGWNAYSSAFLYYRYDAAGVYVGMQRVRSVIELGAGGDGFVGSSVVEILDANDNLLMAICAQAVGTRFQ
jgi:hypothetical protein